MLRELCRIGIVILGVWVGELSAARNPAFAQDAPREAPPPAFREVHVIGGVSRFSRAPVFTDAVLSDRVAGRWTQPTDGATVELPDGSTRTWRRVENSEDGELRQVFEAGGYVWATARSDTETILLLEASGHSMVYVNDEPRVGDGYRTGYVIIPVLLRAGENEFLFASGRGELQARLTRPSAAALLSTRDATAPDALVGAPLDAWAAVVVMNASTEALLDARLSARCGEQTHITALPPLPPLGVRKVAFRIGGEAAVEAGERTVELTLTRGHAAKGVALHVATLPIRVRRPHESRKHTYLSSIDDSVQYYALQPAAADTDGPPPGLVLSLHGASVEATSQADAYQPKDWAHIVAPTNRRPYGFDWEDWGRIDALEAFEAARDDLRPDPRRIYLTGHSMGGHGTWHIGVTFPCQFAAIAPSAGWISFWSYAGAERVDASDPVQALLSRAANPSDTLALSRNFRHHGVYILHGERDDNVPAEQSRQMREHLGGFHDDFDYHEQPDAGHWWGNECVDWPPLFNFLRDRVRPSAAFVERVEFVTASPGVSATCHWVTVEAQERPLDFSRIDLRADAAGRRIVGTVENVTRLRLSLRGEELGRPDAGAEVSRRSTAEIDASTRNGFLFEPGAPLSVELNGRILRDVPWPHANALRVGRTDDGWEVLPPLPSEQNAREQAARSVQIANAPGPRFLKGPHRYGPFKEAFRNRVQLVYGTHGTPAENAWALSKARYDAEVFWYRGNGSFDVIPDTQFRPDAEPDRNVVLYGNADTNSAWAPLMSHAAFRIARDGVTVAVERDGQPAAWSGPELALLGIAPRPDSDVALVGVVSGTGLPGLRLTERLPYFVSGVAYPDWVVLDTSMLRAGYDGVRAAGFLDERWSGDPAQSAWRASP